MTMVAAFARLKISFSLPAPWERFPAMELAGDAVRQQTFVLRSYESVAISA
jgi:cytochrome P450